MTKTATAIAVGLLGLFLACCSGPTYMHRFRLTIAIETPDGLKTGTGIIEVRGRHVKSISPEGSGFKPGTIGEAIFVDLGRGRNIVALLALGSTFDYNQFPYLAALAFGRPGQEADFEWLTAHKGRVDLESSLTPTLITLDDINNPNSARIVGLDQFRATFGSGYRFFAATIEMTQEPVTRGIEKNLPGLISIDRWNKMLAPRSPPYTEFSAGYMLFKQGT